MKRTINDSSCCPWVGSAAGPLKSTHPSNAPSGTRSARNFMLSPRGLCPECLLPGINAGQRPFSPRAAGTDEGFEPHPCSTRAWLYPSANVGLGNGLARDLTATELLLRPDGDLTDDEQAAGP